MPSSFNLEIVTPDRKFYKDTVEMVIVITPQGEMGILPGHQPIVVAVGIGHIRIKKNNEWTEAFLSEGFLEVNANKTVILTDSAEWPHEIDENRAKAAQLRAQERIQRDLSKVEYTQTRAAMARAMARLKVKKEVK